MLWLVKPLCVVIGKTFSMLWLVQPSLYCDWSSILYAVIGQAFSIPRSKLAVVSRLAILPSWIGMRSAITGELFCPVELVCGLSSEESYSAPLNWYVVCHHRRAILPRWIGMRSAITGELFCPVELVCGLSSQESYSAPLNWYAVGRHKRAILPSWIVTRSAITGELFCRVELVGGLPSQPRDLKNARKDRVSVGQDSPQKWSFKEFYKTTRLYQSPRTIRKL
jgi:hypothetical protein